MKQIQAKKINIGKNVVIEPTAIIRGLNGDAEEITIGDNTYIGDSVQIICDNFSIGDYCKMHHHTNVHGYKPCVIGHNAWIGQGSLLDSIGGLEIGDNCCIGSYTHLWTHMKYGDTLEGCRFLSEKPMKIGKDVWFGGHCSITPINAEDKSMVLASAVVTTDLKYNRIYAGNPAKDITDKLGSPFREVPLDEKMKMMKGHLQASGVDANKIKIVESESEFRDDTVSYFSVSTRTYTKRQTKDEIAFMKYLLPEKGKFTPA